MNSYLFGITGQFQMGKLFKPYSLGELMNEVTLQLPKTLYRNLEVLAECEAVPMSQYIVYILTSQMPKGSTVQVIPEEDVMKQKVSFDNLIRKWGKITSSEADKILDRREAAKPEADLDPEVISRLKIKIARSKSNHMNA